MSVVAPVKTAGTVVSRSTIARSNPPLQRGGMSNRGRISIPKLSPIEALIVLAYATSAYSVQRMQTEKVEVKQNATLKPIITFKEQNDIATKAFDRFMSLQNYAANKVILAQDSINSTIYGADMEEGELQLCERELEKQFGLVKQENIYQTIIENAQAKGVNLRREDFDDENIVLTYDI